jgi:hypothetical protein
MFSTHYSSSVSATNNNDLTSYSTYQQIKKCRSSHSHTVTRTVTHQHIATSHHAFINKSTWWLCFFADMWFWCFTCVLLRELFKSLMCWCVDALMRLFVYLCVDVLMCCVSMSWCVGVLMCLMCLMCSWCVDVQLMYRRVDVLMCWCVLRCLKLAAWLSISQCKNENAIMYYLVRLVLHLSSTWVFASLLKFDRKWQVKLSMKSSNFVNLVSPRSSPCWFWSNTD